MYIYMYMYEKKKQTNKKITTHLSVGEAGVRRAVRWSFGGDGSSSTGPTTPPLYLSLSFSSSFPYAQAPPQRRLRSFRAPLLREQHYQQRSAPSAKAVRAPARSIIPSISLCPQREERPPLVMCVRAGSSFLPSFLPSWRCAL